jgi:hypothetical protein
MINPPATERLQLPGVKVIAKTLVDGRLVFYYRHRASGTMLGSSADHEGVRLKYDEA